MKIGKLREKIREENLEAFLSRGSAEYLAGTAAASAVFVTEDRSVLLCSRLDYERAKRESEIEDVRAFAKVEVPIRDGEKAIFGSFGEVILKILQDLDVSRVGYDSLKNRTISEVKDCGELELVENPDLIWDLRVKKTSEELDKIRKSAKIASRAMEKASTLVEPGISELEIATELEYEMRKLGSGGTAFDTIVAGGRNSWLPHTETSDKELEKGELLIVDLGARWERYRSDMTRTFPVSPTSEQEDLVEAAIKAQNAAMEAVESGVEAKKIDEVGRKVFRDEGYEKFFLHGTGHGVGLDIHEPPSLSPASDDVLEKGMVITIEPGVYVEGVGGSRFEDMLLVEEDGYERLTR